MPSDSSQRHASRSAALGASPVGATMLVAKSDCMSVRRHASSLLRGSRAACAAPAAASRSVVTAGEADGAAAASVDTTKELGVGVIASTLVGGACSDAVQRTTERRDEETPRCCGGTLCR